MIEAAPSFTARAISPDRADAAYPLARIAAPTLTIDAWRRLVTRLCRNAAPDPGVGILTAEDRDGYIHGLGTHHPAIDFDHGGEILHADLVVPDLFDPRPVAMALLLTLRGEAERCGCRAIEVHLPARHLAPPDRSHALAAALAGAGYDAAAPVLRWRLALAVGR